MPWAGGGLANKGIRDSVMDGEAHASGGEEGGRQGRGGVAPAPISKTCLSDACQQLTATERVEGD